MMIGNKIKTALVSTNSITQGEQVASVWQPLYERFGIHIDFAYRTFIWDSEASIKAHVHCVIIGFSTSTTTTYRKILDQGSAEVVTNISPYLIDSEAVFIESRSRPICDVPTMSTGIFTHCLVSFLAIFFLQNYYSTYQQSLSIVSVLVSFFLTDTYKQKRQQITDFKRKTDHQCHFFLNADPLYGRIQV